LVIARSFTTLVLGDYDGIGEPFSTNKYLMRWANEVLLMAQKSVGYLWFN
jgi:hypothetical protein